MWTLRRITAILLLNNVINIVIMIHSFSLDMTHTAIALVSFFFPQNRLYADYSRVNLHIQYVETSVVDERVQ